MQEFTNISIILTRNFKDKSNMMKKIQIIELNVLLMTFAVYPPTPVMAQTNKRPSEKEVSQVHEKALTVDTHCDTPMNMVRRNFDIGKRNATGKVDLPRMKEGGLDAMFFAAFTSQKPRNTKNYAEAFNLAQTMIDTIHSKISYYNDQAEIGTTSGDAARIEKSGKRTVYIGMENGFPLAKDLARVEAFYNKGVRYITLCHSFNNDICDSSTDPKGPEHDGLSPFGYEVVKEMNRLGMIIDVSHISDKSFFDVVKVSSTPVIASHSSVRAIAHHPRNMSDEMINALAQNGGVIQICLLNEYIKDPDTTATAYKKEREMRKTYNEKFDSLSETEKAEFRKKWDEMRQKSSKKLPTVSDYVDHIDHVVKLAGIDHVGIGSDFDGGGGLSDCKDVSQFPNITRELLKRGYSEFDIDKIWGGNFFRVFLEVEKIAGK
jgi:membrane dipeptidase